MTQRILVIEDERDIADLIQLHLRDLDYAVTIARDGNAGLRQATTLRWDMIILDLRLPGIDGLEICRQIRRESQYVPILMLTSKSSELDRVVGLEVGADDYVTKPFSILELKARVRPFQVKSVARQISNKTISALCRNTPSKELAVFLSELEWTLGYLTKGGEI